MPRIPILALAACCLLPAYALELSDLRLPLTRSEADKALSRDYSFRVLEDMTIRRSWGLKNRTVSVDFSPKEGDKALLIYIDYTHPVAPEVAAEDAAKLLGTSAGSWKKLDEKRALRLGMEVAEGFKLAGNRYCFRELNEGGQVVRLAYYAGTPGVVRWDLADDVRETGRTAMGSRSGSGKSDVLWKDEERRRGVSAASSASSLASAAAAVVAEDAPALPKPAKVQMVKRPEEPFDLVATVKKYVAELTPRHYAIAGAVLALLLLVRWGARAREAKRRAMVADYIMKHGVIDTREDRRRR